MPPSPRQPKSWYYSLALPQPDDKLMKMKWIPLPVARYQEPEILCYNVPVKGV